MEEVPGVTSVLSYHKMLGTAIPDFFIPEDVKNMLRQEGWQLMMVNSSYAPATDEVSGQLDAMNDILHSYDPSAMITGEGAMYRDLIDTSSVDFQVTNYISIAAIFLIIAFVFRSITIPLVLVATIELAIFINQGCCYFLGTEIPFIAPTIISCVQLGATVDYAILMTSRFQEELKKGLDRKEAIRIAAASSDASIVTSALVLFCATLGVSFVSSIDLIGAICVMLSRGALISALVSIFLMPAILCVCEPVLNKTSYHWKTPDQAAPLPLAPPVEEAPKALEAPETAEAPEAPAASAEQSKKPEKKARRWKKARWKAVPEEKPAAEGPAAEESTGGTAPEQTPSGEEVPAGAK